MFKHTHRQTRMHAHTNTHKHANRHVHEHAHAQTHSNTQISSIVPEKMSPNEAINTCLKEETRENKTEYVTRVTETKRINQ